MAVIPETHDLTIYRGADFPLRFTLTALNEAGESVPVDLTGWAVKSQIREKWGRDEPLLAEFAVTPETLTDDGVFYLTLTDTQTAAMDAKKGVYDVILTDTAGIAEVYFRGDVEILKSSTDITV